MDRILYDRRVVRRNISKDLVTAKEYERYIKELPDLQGQCELLDLTFASLDEEGKSHDGSPEDTGDGVDAPEV